MEVDEQFERIEINVDAARLKGVFGELLDNAIKFTEKGGIRVECIVESDSLIVRFSDTGSSIPAELFPKIFDRFSSKSVDDPTIQGAGLGLYICKAIITAHGGTIIARNNTGAGAVFEVKLPLPTLPKSVKATAAVT